MFTNLINVGNSTLDPYGILVFFQLFEFYRPPRIGGLICFLACVNREAWAKARKGGTEQLAPPLDRSSRRMSGGCPLKSLPIFPESF
jgi:hypothetical protein